jgi:hypothetical protein
VGLRSVLILPTDLAGLTHGFLPEGPIDATAVDEQPGRRQQSRQDSEGHRDFEQLRVKAARARVSNHHRHQPERLQGRLAGVGALEDVDHGAAVDPLEMCHLLVEQQHHAVGKLSAVHRSREFRDAHRVVDSGTDLVARARSDMKICNVGAHNALRGNPLAQGIPGRGRGAGAAEDE